MSEEVKWDRGHWNSGQLWFEIPYVNGQKHGIQRCWYSNGQLAYETPFLNNQWHGIGRWWKKDGKLWSIEKWHQGQKVINIKLDPIPDDAAMELDLITNKMSYE